MRMMFIQCDKRFFLWRGKLAILNVFEVVLVQLLNVDDKASSFGGEIVET